MEIGSLVSTIHVNINYDISVYADQDQFETYFYAGLTPPKDPATGYFQTLSYNKPCLVLDFVRWHKVKMCKLFCLEQNRIFYAEKQWLQEFFP